MLAYLVAWLLWYGTWGTKLTVSAASVVQREGVWWGSQEWDWLHSNWLYSSCWSHSESAKFAAGQRRNYFKPSASTRFLEERSRGPDFALARGRKPLSTIIEVRMGWPARCCRGAIIDTSSDAHRIEYSGIWRIRDWKLPYHFIPLGLVLNTIFYGSITALLWFAFARGRAALRRRRGLCARCKYNLAGLAPAPATDFVICTECGFAQLARSARLATP